MKDQSAVAAAAEKRAEKYTRSNHVRHSHERLCAYKGYVIGFLAGDTNGYTRAREEMAAVVENACRVLERRCYACDEGDKYEDYTCDMVMSAKVDALKILSGLRDQGRGE